MLRSRLGFILPIIAYEFLLATPGTHVCRSSGQTPLRAGIYLSTMEQSLKDIQTREDIEQLIDEFYKLVIKDDLIGFFFTDVVGLDWEVHIPIMYRFWESMLLDKRTYQGNPMTKHIQLNKKATMLPAHFERWLGLWEKTVQANFQGTVADKAIQKAQQIGGLMQYKEQQNGLS